MAKIVSEIMNQELFAVRPSDVVEDVSGLITMLGITGAAVVDADNKPIGHVSLRDLLRTGGRSPVSEVMTSPAATVAASETIERAARGLAEQNRHRLVVVDEQGRAVGMVSALDVIRGLLGLPAMHPQSFPHFDTATGLSWSDDAVLELDHVAAAPNGPGVLALVHGGVGMRERLVWAEGCENVRARLYAILSAPHPEQPLLARALSLGNLRFRSASAPDDAIRARALEIVQGLAMAALRPARESGAS